MKIHNTAHFAKKQLQEKTAGEGEKEMTSVQYCGNSSQILTTV